MFADFVGLGVNLRVGDAVCDGRDQFEKRNIPSLRGAHFFITLQRRRGIQPERMLVQRAHVRKVGGAFDGEFQVRQGLDIPIMCGGQNPLIVEKCGGAGGCGTTLPECGHKPHGLEDRVVQEIRGECPAGLEPVGAGVGEIIGNENSPGR